MNKVKRSFHKRFSKINTRYEDNVFIVMRIRLLVVYYLDY